MRRCFLFELFSEVGSFAAAARAAAVVLLHSLALEEKAPFTNQPRPTKQEQPRKGPAQCFVRIKPGEYPTLWSIYRPKFADGEAQGVKFKCAAPNFSSSVLGSLVHKN